MISPASPPAERDVPIAPGQRTGPLGRLVRLLLAVGFAYSLGTLVDQGGPLSVRHDSALADPPFVVLTVAMVAVYAILVTQVAKALAGERAARTALRVALLLLAAAIAAGAAIGELAFGEVWGPPLSDLVWTLDVALLFQTTVALAIAVVLGTPGCEIGVWPELLARVRRGPVTSPPICIIGLYQLDQWELQLRDAPR